MIFTISGNSGFNVGAWALHISNVIPVIRSKYPNVERIVLQPVVGGPNHEVCPRNTGGNIRASEQHPFIDDAIARVVAEDTSGNVVGGFSPEVRTCADYVQDIGHLVSEATGPIGQIIGDHCAGK